MPIFTSKRPEFQVTAPDGWRAFSDEYGHEDDALVLERTLNYRDLRPDSCLAGYLTFNADPEPDGVAPHDGAEGLLNAILEEGNAQKWGEPERIITSEKPSLFAQASYLIFP
jgi:hypothetical protein